MDQDGSIRIALASSGLLSFEPRVSCFINFYRNACVDWTPLVRCRQAAHLRSLATDAAVAASTVSGRERENKCGARPLGLVSAGLAPLTLRQFVRAFV